MADGQASGGELVWEDRLPLAWQALDSSSATEIAHLYEAALTRLNAILTVGEALAAEPSEEAPARGHELVRLEARLNLLLAMVGELLRAQRPLPPPRSTRLSGTGLEWEDPAPPVPGQLVAVDLYLNPALPDAMSLPARIEAVEPRAGGGATVRATFPDEPAAVRNGLEKLIFRNHRRRVAEQRKVPPPA